MQHSHKITLSNGLVTYQPCVGVHKSYKSALDKFCYGATVVQFAFIAGWILERVFSLPKGF